MIVCKDISEVMIKDESKDKAEISKPQKNLMRDNLKPNIPFLSKFNQ